MFNNDNSCSQSVHMLIFFLMTKIIFERKVEKLQAVVLS